MKIRVFLFWTFVLVEEESFVVEAMLTLVSNCGHVHVENSPCSLWRLESPFSTKVVQGCGLEVPVVPQVTNFYRRCLGVTGRTYI